MAHVNNPEADRILDKEYKVLDRGFVRLVDYLGGDERIVQSARVSYGKGTKTVSEDRKLVSFLLRNEHMSPFEQVVFTFHVKMPIFVARQWIRHRTARVNEISGRYSEMKNEFYLPAHAQIRRQSQENMQGRGEDMTAEEKAEVLEILRRGQEAAFAGYGKMLTADVARELARI